MAYEAQAKSATASSPSFFLAGPDDDDDAAANRRWGSVGCLREHRRVLWCCGCCATTVVVLGVVILVLSFTLFKVQDPEITMNSITVARLSFGSPLDDPAHAVPINATLAADVSIKNRNLASFQFGNSTTDFYYAGENIGLAYAPGGRVGARRTARMDVTVDVLTNRVASEMNLTTEVLAAGGAEVDLTSFTNISGRVNALGVYKRDLEVTLSCSMTLGVSLVEHELKRFECVSTVK